MVIPSGLNSEILARTGWSSATLSRRAQEIRDEYGPMSSDDARYLIAHDAHIDLLKFGLTDEDLVRLRGLRQGGPVLVRASLVPAQNSPTSAAPAPNFITAKAETPGAMFDGRTFHPSVALAARRLFAGGHRTKAIEAALKSVNNRVKRLANLDLDGVSLMNKAFSEQKPVLALNELRNASERDEHNGLRNLMAGAMMALRNPRAHEDEWPPDEDVSAALESLSLASLLHRYLDRCEKFMAPALPPSPSR